MARPLLLVLLLGLLCIGAQGRCMLQLAIRPAASPFVGSGKATAPFDAVITRSRLNATGSLFLAVPGTTCPPDLTASNAVELLQQGSLVLPLDEKSISFTPKDIKGTVNTSSTNSIAVFDLLDLDIGFSGNDQPLSNGSVVLGTASAAEALKAAQPLCAQLVLLDGLLNLTSPTLGLRTSNVTHVAFNRTLAVGASVRKTGARVTDITLALRNATMLLNITPESTPGVEFSRATYLLAGDVVAAADLSDAASWIELADKDADWSSVRRLDAPVVMGTSEEPVPRFVGVNDTEPQECSAAAGGAGAPAAAGEAPAAAGAPAKSAAVGLRASLGSVAAALAGAAALAAMVL